MFIHFACYPSVIKTSLMLKISIRVVCVNGKHPGSYEDPGVDVELRRKNHARCLSEKFKLFSMLRFRVLQFLPFVLYFSSSNSSTFHGEILTKEKTSAPILTEKHSQPTRQGKF